MPETYQTLSVVVPVYCEAGGVVEFHTQLENELKQTGLEFSVVYVNDGSTDETEQVLESICDRDPKTGYLSLSRNHGKEAALIAGLDHCNSDLVLFMDADLQHPPEILHRMLDRIRDGADMVCAVRTHRKDQGFRMNAGAKIFYWFMNRFSEVELVPNSSDFRLFNRSVAEAYRSLREAHRFSRGLFSWLGFRQENILYMPEPRLAGSSKWGGRKLARYGLEGMTSFSVAPLRAVTVIGSMVAMLALAYGAYILIKTLLVGDPVPGFPTLIIVILFFAGLQLLAIGLIGEYIGKIFQESKKRPLYFLSKSRLAADPGRAEHPEPENQK